MPKPTTQGNGEDIEFGGAASACEVVLPGYLRVCLADTCLQHGAQTLLLRLSSVLPERLCGVSRVPLLPPLVWSLSVGGLGVRATPCMWGLGHGWHGMTKHYRSLPH